MFRFGACETAKQVFSLLLTVRAAPRRRHHIQDEMHRGDGEWRQQPMSSGAGAAAAATKKQQQEEESGETAHEQVSHGRHRQHHEHADCQLDVFTSTVGDAMTTGVIAVEKTRSIVECARLMQSQKVNAWWSTKNWFPFWRAGACSLRRHPPTSASNAEQ